MTCIDSAEAEHEFAAYFDRKELGHIEIEFYGRSDYGPFLEAGIAAGGIACGAEMLKTEEEAALFGGEAGDIVDNLNATAWTAMTDASTHMTAVYAASWETIPLRSKRKRSLETEMVTREEANMMGRVEKAGAERRALEWLLELMCGGGRRRPQGLKDM
ncbi:hypothetical protein N431DRAFT_449611 [Stipitochalara longipes BDJ]|nr:hypothetical protein N431DRAFT_449611 [Stipitochalara longipes BDJ]